ncbi:hypothetical protein BDV29DRAFT_173944 [Aspergillus leporis]|jgi:hypothetical protein|uniref:Uncharacterized protein n=1 Tax=Aspergillus leporis TaxID=41062 RepID=A0A5N5X096_9EURO|nr:hypothetical protein BDV29DRAFT_173944 [Aspergillus leporis]
MRFVIAICISLSEGIHRHSWNLGRNGGLILAYLQAAAISTPGLVGRARYTDRNISLHDKDHLAIELSSIRANQVPTIFQLLAHWPTAHEDVRPSIWAKTLYKSHYSHLLRAVIFIFTLISTYFLWIIQPENIVSELLDS